jgi:hypothetical protein
MAAAIELLVAVVLAERDIDRQIVDKRSRRGRRDLFRQCVAAR